MVPRSKSQQPSDQICLTVILAVPTLAAPESQPHQADVTLAVLTPDVPQFPLDHNVTQGAMIRDVLDQRLLRRQTATLAALILDVLSLRLLDNQLH